MTFVNLYHPISPYNYAVWVEEHECPGNVDKHFYMVKLDDCRGRISDKDQLQHLLKAICQALIGDKREDLTEDEALLANRAGYTVADRDGDRWLAGRPFRFSSFSLFSAPFSITSTNGENEPEQPATVTISRVEYESLKKLAGVTEPAKKEKTNDNI